MGTRCLTKFESSPGEVEAVIYRHWDGYPEGAGTDIYRFFADVKQQTDDTRFNDANYLAAKYVVWLARQFTTFPMDKYLDFLSVGIMPDGQDWGTEYTYHVISSDLDPDTGYPTLICIDSGGEVCPVPHPTP